VIRERGEKIDRSDLVSAAIVIEQQYAEEYEVRTLFDKADF
jgi:hypothetical protein